MKKLIILCMVLALCSTASAALTVVVTVDPEVGDAYTWDGTSSVKPSDIITIDWMETGTNLGFANLSVRGDGDYVEDSLAWQAAMGGLAVTSTATEYTISGNLLYMPGTGAINPVITWDFHVPDMEDSTWITITIAGTYGGDPIDPSIIEIHVTPEPMTIMLLGLGGLFLRRRII